MPPSQFVWVCPTCARAVPNRMTACRCGYRRDAAAPSPALAAPAPTPPVDTPVLPSRPAPAPLAPAAARIEVEDSEDGERANPIKAVLVLVIACSALSAAWFAGTWPFPSAVVADERGPDLVI